MFKNYLKIAWRNIFHHKAYAAINIVGLALGIAACLLILQYVNYELGFDRQHARKENIYRVIQDRYDNGKLSTQWAAGAYAVGSAFKEAFPEIDDYVRLNQAGSQVLRRGNDLIKLENPYFASSSFFKIFSFPLVKGDPATALKEPFTVALSETLAKKLFGSVDVLGKELKVTGDRIYKVTAVYKDMPSQSHMHFEALFSFASFVQLIGPDNNPDNAWNWDGCLTYLLLKPGTDPKKLEKKFMAVVTQKNGESLKQYNADVKYYLQPLTDIHLYSNRMLEAGANGDGKTTYLLMGIAFFVVLIAWINYINLATARAISRAKEVGIRKAVGSQRSQLIGQFLFESALLNAMAVALAFVIILAVVPLFNRLTGQSISIGQLGGGMFWLNFLLLYIAGSFISGIYPALVLSSFKPIVVLKGKLVHTTQGSYLRKGLVVLQFAASLFLLIGTLAVSKQIRYMKKQELGMNIDQTLVIKKPIVVTDSTFLNQLTSFKNSLEGQSGIQKASSSTSVPGEPVGWNAGGIRLLSQPENVAKQYRVIGVDYDYVDMFDLKVKAGRNFSRDFGEKKGVIFNESAANQIGFTKPEDAIGKDIFFWGDTLRIVGVVHNFHQQSLRDAFEPLILRLFPDVRGYISLKVHAADVKGSITKVEKEWNRFFPGNTFEYFFLDEHFNSQYKSDQQFGLVFGIFTTMAIFVACMGLFGLASFTTLQKTKEIGIRKVLGASVNSILKALYQEFAWLILVAFVIATPIAWFAINKWLEGYAFRMRPDTITFVLPLLVILLVALITVSYQTIKAALANPVHSLRTE
ncbi:ABC transporter permease [Flavihumibacter petaseus]|uniref:Putative ABC transporter permease protein n=1 Tax=Flavihumibacter petaseus NBRC 106054 TaxID=1220578 RepID=A0A0E9N3Z8_9BACT|nr:ABC transporter permease [Flavihumibacter petaseus]GAO44381.1 putative ABC transporter permease protein [Flavihumibacter petaseus NBRC 106054]